MLVLTRKNGQTIQVGEISITLVGVKGDRARIGIEAPREVPILRGEIAENNRQIIENPGAKILSIAPDGSIRLGAMETGYEPTG